MVKRLPAVHCFGAVACDGVKHLSLAESPSCWGNETWNYLQDKRTPLPLKQSLFRLSCVHFRCPALYRLKEITQCICCFSSPHTHFPPYLVCLYFIIPAICSQSTFFPIHISTSKSPLNISPASSVFFSCCKDIEAFITGFHFLHGAIYFIWSVCQLVTECSCKAAQKLSQVFITWQVTLELRINEFPRT